jgi:hypothetical protein
MNTSGVYSDVKEKNKICDREYIDNFDNLISELEKYNDYEVFFRGQSNASWKIHSSSKRLHDRECTIGGCKCYFRRTKNLIDKLKSVINKPDSYDIKTDFEILSALQHYGVPTPLIDFTSSFKTALYFAVNKNNYFDTKNSVDLNQMFSVYIVRPSGDWTNVENLVKDFGVSFLDYKFVEEISLVYLKENEGKILKLTNDRIIKQSGLFIYLGGRSNNLSLEDYCCQADNDLKKGNSTKALLVEKIKCIDAPVSMFGKIRNYLESEGINSKTMGFQ